MTQAKLTKETAEIIAEQHNVIVDAKSGMYNHNDAEYGWQAIPEWWIAEIEDTDEKSM